MREFNLRAAVLGDYRDFIWLFFTIAYRHAQDA
jgi:hypothetical protein